MLLSSLVGKSLAVKVVLGLAGLSAAGVGVAAETGTLPSPVQQAAHQVAAGLGVPAPTSRTTVRSADAPPDPTDSPEPVSSAEPSPSVSAGHGPDATGPAAKGLCAAYNSGRKAGRSNDSAAFQALAAAAGGRDAIDGYCAQVLASPTPDPGRSDTPQRQETPAADTTAHGNSDNSTAGKGSSGTNGAANGSTTSTSHGGSTTPKSNGHH